MKIAMKPAIGSVILLLVIAAAIAVLVSLNLTSKPGAVEQVKPLTNDFEEPREIYAEKAAEKTKAEVTPDSIVNLAESFGRIGPISSILISQKGNLVAEEYFGRMNARRGHNIKSASKSILSILTGIAIDRGYLRGTDQPIGEYFPDYFEANPDSVKESITIGDLLTMRSGLASTSRRSYGRWVVSENWVDYVLDRPLTGTPGIDRNYSTGSTHLLAVIIARASGMSLYQFANRYLFDPMDIRVAGWDRDPQGYYMGGNNMALKPRDMVKIGELMMNMGVYNGEQLVPSKWIVESVKPVTGRRAGINNYGYLWFRRTVAGREMVYAFGNGGQYIMILPEIESVITVTTRIGAGNTRSWRRELFRVLNSGIVPGLGQIYSGV